MIAEIEAGDVTTVIVKDMSWPKRDMRYIAISDGVDSATGTSKKVRAIKRAQGQAGEHLTKPPYDYIVSPADKKKRIEIAKILKADNVPIAKAYYAEKKGKPPPDDPYNWNVNTITSILERMDYCGHTVNFKSYSKSHKLKKQIPTAKEQQAVFYNTHEAIVGDPLL